MSGSLRTHSSTFSHSYTLRSQWHHCRRLNPDSCSGSCKHRCKVEKMFANNSRTFLKILSCSCDKQFPHRTCWHHTFFTGRLNTAVVVWPANNKPIQALSFIAAALALPVCSSFTLFLSQVALYSCSFLQRNAVVRHTLHFLQTGCMTDSKNFVNWK